VAIVPTNTLEPTKTPTTAPTATPTLPPIQATLVELINLVDAHPMAGGDWVKALLNMALFPGGEVWAKEASTALVGLKSDRVRVAPNTIFTLSQPDASTLKLNLQEGQMWLNVEGLKPGEKFEVETPAAVAAVRGTRFSVRVDPDDTTTISCLDGSVSVTSTVGTTVTVSYKFQTVIRPGGDPEYPAMITNTEIIRWGMAAGPYLDVVVPTGELLDTYTVPGMTSYGTWSGDDSFFSFTYYAPDLEEKRSQLMFYFLPSAALVVPTGIPTDTYKVAYNPAGDGAAWGQNVEGQSSICTGTLNSNNPVCFGPPGTGYFPELPVWSPDGQWLLYPISVMDTKIVTEFVHVDNLYRSRPDGSEMMQLTFSDSSRIGYYGRYTWSPDGTQIAYAYTDSEDWEAHGQAWMMKADGSAPHMIYDDLLEPRYNDPLPWSPDGMWLALSSSQGLFLVSPDGKTIQQIPDTEAGSYYNVQWSPTVTGWPLLYHYYNETDKKGGTYFTVGEDATPQGFYLSSWGPVYSPDGKRVAFGFNQQIGDKTNPRYRSTIYFFQVLPLWP
jgi:hypothetical protein